MSLLDNLAAWWELGESSGTRSDSTGNGNNFSSNGGVGVAAGKVGNCATFAAASLQYLSLATNASINPGDVDYCIAAWVYLASKPAVGDIVAKRTGLGNLQFALRYLSSPDRFQFLVSADGNVPVTTIDADSFGAPSTGTWYLVIAWHDAVANTISIQVNNGPVDSTSHAGGIYSGAIVPLTIGAVPEASEYFDGRIDQVGIWKGGIPTAPERASLYNGGAGLAYADLAGGGVGPEIPAFDIFGRGNSPIGSRLIRAL